MTVNSVTIRMGPGTAGQQILHFTLLFLNEDLH